MPQHSDRTHRVGHQGEMTAHSPASGRPGPRLASGGLRPFLALHEGRLMFLSVTCDDPPEGDPPEE